MRAGRRVSGPRQPTHMCRLAYVWEPGHFATRPYTRPLPFVRESPGSVECQPRKQASKGGLTLNAPTRPTEETARLGDEIYQRDIRAKVEGTHHGQVVAIDVDSGDYAIADTGLAAADALRKRRPARDVWAVRVGYPTLRTFGGNSARRGG